MKALYFIAVALAAASVYFNRRSDVWADRCLFLAYGLLFVSVAAMRFGRG